MAASSASASKPRRHKVANQPNVFHDPKSAESALPYFSSGGRDDFAQRRYLEAVLKGWNADDPAFVAAANPVSEMYAGRMVDASRIYLWAWDARPFPAFPLSGGSWSDGSNWYTGHWLNGRLSGIAAGDLFATIVDDFGLPAADTADVCGFMTGYTIAGPASARSVLEPLLDLFGARDSQNGEIITFSSLPGAPGAITLVDDVVSNDGEPHLVFERASAEDLPGDVALGFADPMREYQSAVTRLFPTENQSGRIEILNLPAVMEQGIAETLAAEYRRRRRTARTSVSFAIAHGPGRLETGDVIELAQKPGSRFEIIDIEDGEYRRINARRVEFLPPVPDLRGLPGSAADIPSGDVAPLAYLIDLPLWDGLRKPEDQLRVAVRASPWRPHSVSVSPENSGFSARAVVEQPATTGQLQQALSAGVSGRMDTRSEIRLVSPDGEFASVSRQLLLGGANLATILSSSGEWEVLQFQSAEDLGGGSWRLADLLRGQAGTEDAAAAGAPEGAPFVLLDEAVVPAGLRGGEIGLALNWRIQPLKSGIAGQNTKNLTAAGGLRALLTYAPVHLRGAGQVDGSIAFTWIRRGRLDADNWLPGDIPLGEDSEAWLVEIIRNGSVIRSVETAAANWTYASADRAADLGSTPATFDLRIRQVSARAGPGLAASRTFFF